MPHAHTSDALSFRPIVMTAATAIVTMMLAVVMMVSAPIAHGHDVLVDNVPADGEILAESPESVVLSFNNSVLDIGEKATVIRLNDSEGTEISFSDPPVVTNRDVTLPLGELSDGAYRITWRVVSSDGHPIQGTFTFGVGDVSEELVANVPMYGDRQVEPVVGEIGEDPVDISRWITIVLGLATVGVLLLAIYGRRKRRA